MRIEEKDMIVGQYYVGSWGPPNKEKRIIFQFKSSKVGERTHLIDANNRYCYSAYGHGDLNWREATQGERETLIAAIEVALRRKLVKAEREYNTHVGKQTQEHFNFTP